MRAVDGFGATHFNWRVDLQKCKTWGVSALRRSAVLQVRWDGSQASTMIEGEKQFDIAVRSPQWRRGGDARRS